MAIVWIVTIGNSDIRLDANASKAFNKDLSNPEKSKSLGNRNKFRPEEDKSKKGEFSLQARVLGIVYGDAIANHWNYFKFPLLDEFCNKLTTEKIKPDRIIVLLTDQEAIFDVSDRADPDSPYWKDTCTLEPILRHYFSQHYDEAFSQENVEFDYLKPESGQDGLDDWDTTLKFVRARFKDWEKDGWIFSEDETKTIIVSHQAGTPAISSAVQLTSLIRFGGEVKMLVSSEMGRDTTKLIEGASYFHALQFKKLNELLKRYDYTGIKNELDYLKLNDSDAQQRLLSLIDAAIKWNLADFDGFRNSLSKIDGYIDSMPDNYKENYQAWWRVGYESAYLAVVRHDQGSIVEALFHGFRAFEGVISKFIEEKLPKHIRDVPNKGLQLKDTVKEERTDLRKYWDDIWKRVKSHDFAKSQLRGNEERQEKNKTPFPLEFGLFGVNLSNLFKMLRPDWKDNKYIKIATADTNTIRNQQFHRLLFLTTNDLYSAWQAKDFEQWKKNMLGCHNFIAEQSYESLESASLMAHVHQDLEKAISNLADNLCNS